MLILHVLYCSISGSVALKVLYTTLKAQNEDVGDLKDGLLSNRVCTVKFPVGKPSMKQHKL